MTVPFLSRTIEERSPAVTITPGVQSQNSSNLDSTLALAALIFAAIAFVAAFLQALLQYLTSSQRDKCLSGAIGGWSAYTKTRWDITRWRIKVQYPRLKLDPDTLIANKSTSFHNLSVWAGENHSIYDRHIVPRLYYDNLSENFGKVGSIWDLEDRGHIIVAADGPALTFWDLSLSQKISWVWFCLTKRKRFDRGFSKAGWANILGVLGVMPDEMGLDGYEDADTIPMAVDVPIQRMQLQHLCLLCYMVNIKNIDIDIAHGSIEAQNAFVRVTTQQIPGLGRAVSIDGSFSQLEERLSAISSKQMEVICAIAQGYLAGFYIYTNIDYFDETVYLYGLSHQWNNTHWDRYKRGISVDHIAHHPNELEEKLKMITRASPRQQATKYQELSKNSQLSWSEIWTTIQGGCSPTIIKYMAIMPFHGIWSAAPLELFLTPYYQHLDASRKNWFEGLGKQSKCYLKLRQHPQIDLGLAYDTLPIIRAKSDFDVITHYLPGLPLAYSWALFPSLFVLEPWESDIVEQTWQDQTDGLLYLPSVIINLLQGATPQQARQYIETTGSFDYRYYTLESALTFALLLVDCRLQALWCILEKESGGRLTRFHSAAQKISKTDVSRRLKLDKLVTSSRFGFRSKVDPLLPDFLALWFELGNRIDLLVSDINSIEDCLADILNDWKDDDGPCIPEIPIPDLEDRPKSVREMTGLDLKMFNHVAGSRTRRQFVTWALGASSDEKDRLKVIRKMIPLLQLRIFLMDLAYRCHADSSKVYLLTHQANYNVLADVRLI
ncbi:hypothetical protein TWF694_011520 [Orbilia ellipsospora]|uniref:Uncharacterized protein n=1 Tax=Orbilia ellipsospora TaxID=2528407 RepID=A0AAV9X6Q6_9PEZI